MTDFPRIEVSGDKDGGWLAEIHDGVFHHVFGDLTGANENEVKEAALARFAEAHPDTELGREVAAAATEKARAEAEAKGPQQRPSDGEQTSTGFAAVVPPIPEHQPSDSDETTSG